MSHRRFRVLSIGRDSIIVTLYYINLRGSIRETQAWFGHRGIGTGSGRWLVAEFDKMKPPQIAVEVFGGDGRGSRAGSP